MGYEILLRMLTKGGLRFPSRLARSFLLFSLTTCGTAVFSQSPSSSVSILQLNKRVVSALKGGESHFFTLRLEARMFTRVVVEQRGVDVFVRALDRQKKRLVHADDSFGRNGQQLLEFIAETSGDYTVQVRARGEELGGKYEIAFVESRTMTEEDRLLSLPPDNRNSGQSTL